MRSNRVTALLWALVGSLILSFSLPCAFAEITDKAPQKNPIATSVENLGIKNCGCRNGDTCVLHPDQIPAGKSYVCFKGVCSDCSCEPVALTTSDAAARSIATYLEANYCALTPEVCIDGVLQGSQNQSLWKPQHEGLSCEEDTDNNSCTAPGCQNGTCVQNQPTPTAKLLGKTCDDISESLDYPCKIRQCDGHGSCVYQNAPEGTVCGGPIVGDCCSTAFTCQSGKCERNTYATKSSGQSCAPTGVVGQASSCNAQPVCSGCDCVIPCAGQCGSAAKSYLAGDAAFQGQLCASGQPQPASPAFPAAGASASWTCSGENGGTSKDCAASRSATLLCGDNAKNYLYKDTSWPAGSTFCAVGATKSPGTTTSFPAAGGSKTWSCTLAGNTTSCTATRDGAPANAKCGTAAKTYAASATAFSGTFCSVGTADPSAPAFPAHGSSTSWTCKGLYGGTDSTCQAALSKNASCGAAATTYEEGATAPTGELCGEESTTTAKSPPLFGTNYSVSWTCSSTSKYPGSGISCTALRKRNATCGAAETSQGGKAYAETVTAPTAAALCGTASALVDKTPVVFGTNTSVSWECSSTASPPGNNITCSARKKKKALCGPAAAANYSTDATAPSGDLCGSDSQLSGASPTFQNSLTSSWTCSSTWGDPGSNTNCTASRAAFNPSCGSAARPYANTETQYVGAFCGQGSVVGSAPQFPGQNSSAAWQCMGNAASLVVSCDAIRGCSYSRMDVNYEGDWKLGTALTFTGVSSSSQRTCIQSWVNSATSFCAGASVDSSSDFRDDCMALYLLGRAYYQGGYGAIPYSYGVQPFAAGRSKISGEGACYQWGVTNHSNICSHGTAYFDQSCNMLSSAPLSEVCAAAVYGWRLSPISLVWEESQSKEGLVLKKFDLLPGSNKSWHVWKASSAMPLLVWDPKHTGKVTSGRHLFGSMTFGGTSAGEPWGNGYEALAMLDANHDGVVKGKELEPLALWFDANRDAVSQPEEVKSLRDPTVQVSALHYLNVKKRENGDVVAELGFERLDNGRVVKGQSLDWFTESAATEDELRNKIMTVSRMQIPSSAPSATGLASGTTDQPKEIQSDLSQGTPSERAERVTQQAPLKTALSGVWEWSTDDKKFAERGNHKPQGYLSISDLGNGTIRGHSFVETTYAMGQAAKSQIDAVVFTGTQSAEANGQTKVEFSIDLAGNGVTSSAVLDPSGTVMHGVSQADVSYDGKPGKLSYTWVARKSDK